MLRVVLSSSSSLSSSPLLSSFFARIEEEEEEEASVGKESGEKEKSIGFDSKALRITSIDSLKEEKFVTFVVLWG